MTHFPLLMQALAEVVNDGTNGGDARIKTLAQTPSKYPRMPEWDYHGKHADLDQLDGDFFTLCQKYLGGSWTTDWEFELWARVVGDRGAFANDEHLTPEEVTSLQDQATALSGWLHQPDEEAEIRGTRVVIPGSITYFVPLAEWLPLYAAWKARHPV